MSLVFPGTTDRDFDYMDPDLEGAWVEQAHSAFRTSGVDAALTVFDSALAHNRFSLVVWTYYLQFVREMKPEIFVVLCQQALDAVGKHFLAHELWDMRLAAALPEERVTLLDLLLGSYTLHQCAKYHAALVAQLNGVASTAEFAELGFTAFVPELSGTTVDESELERVKQAVATKIRHKYELHRRRVEKRYVFERQIHRPFFDPQREGESEVWAAYADSLPDSDALTVYRRAIVPCARDPQMWLAYIRCCRRCGENDEALAERCTLPAVKHHRDMWLNKDKAQRPSIDDMLTAALKESQYINV